MISIVRFWESVTQLAKIGTAGYEAQDEFNRTISSVQTSAMTTLAPRYNSTRAVKDLLGPFVKTLPTLTDAQGVLDKPADYFQLCSASVGVYPAPEVDVNEIRTISQIPSRRPSTANNRFVHYESNDKFNFLPAEEHDPVTIIYIRQPAEAKIVLTAAETDEDDYLVPTANGDLEWPERAFNLLLFLVLQRFGVEIEKQLILEYANYGIEWENNKI